MKRIRKPVDPLALKAYNRAKSGPKPAQTPADIRMMRQLVHRLELAAVDRVKSFQVIKD